MARRTRQSPGRQRRVARIVSARRARRAASSRRQLRGMDPRCAAGCALTTRVAQPLRRRPGHMRSLSLLFAPCDPHTVREHSSPATGWARRPRTAPVEQFSYSRSPRPASVSVRPFNRANHVALNRHPVSPSKRAKLMPTTPYYQA